MILMAVALRDRSMMELGRGVKDFISNVIIIFLKKGHESKYDNILTFV